MSVDRITYLCLLRSENSPQMRYGVTPKSTCTSVQRTTRKHFKYKIIFENHVIIVNYNTDATFLCQFEK